MLNNICFLEVNVYCLPQGGAQMQNLTHVCVISLLLLWKIRWSRNKRLLCPFWNSLAKYGQGPICSLEMMKEKRLDRVNEWTCWWIMVWESSCNNQHYFHIDCNNWVGAGKCTSIAFETISSSPPTSFLWTKYQILHSFQELSSLWGGKSIINNHESQKTFYERALVQTTLFWINNSPKAHLKIKSTKVFA